jgi:hypothetical protein
MGVITMCKFDDYIADGNPKFIDYNWYLMALDRYSDEELIKELNRRRDGRKNEGLNIKWVSK